MKHVFNGSPCEMILMVALNVISLHWICLGQERKKKENRLLNRLGITKMLDDLKELFSTMTGFRNQANQTDNVQTELLLKMCSALDSLPDRLNNKGSTPKLAPTM